MNSKTFPSGFRFFNAGTANSAGLFFLVKKYSGVN